MNAPGRGPREQGDLALTNEETIQHGTRQLRAQMEDITQQIQIGAKQRNSGSEQTLAQGAQELRDLADWIESLAQLLEASPLKRPEQPVEEAETHGSTAESMSQRAFESQLQEMRLRVATLDAELRQTREQSNQWSNQPRRSRRKRKHRSLWGKMKRRLLLS